VPKDEVFHVTVGYGARTRQPFVGIQFRGESVQIPPEEAQELASNLFEAAEASLSDAAIIEWVEGQPGMTQAAAVTLLASFREFRQRRR
jgi:hypothetical protein